MTEEASQKIFEPFYTTKFSGRGLGMSAVLGIVRGHGGAIQVETSLGEGTTFRVYLPASETPANRRPRPTGASTQKWSAHGSVLLVDDEAIVRRATQMMLQAIGFEVTTASDGREAVQVFADRPERFDVVLLDLTMPGMDGSEACVRIRAASPSARVVMMSGYSPEAASVLTNEDPNTHFLQKPFRMDDLRSILRLALESPDEVDGAATTSPSP